MIFDFLCRYSQLDVSRLHMPGHGGKPICGGDFAKIFPFDITEIQGADCLYKAKSCILADEQKTAEIYRVADTFYSAGGCTLCIQTLVYLMKMENRDIFVYGEMHPSFWNICKILNITPVVLENVENISANSCLFLTSVDYFGNIADIAKISEICRKMDCFLIVDNAHGAHLAFTEPSKHPIHLGADFSADSAHKMLPVLTGGAFIHTSHSGFRRKIKEIMSIFGSSSPSYLILASLDICNNYLKTEIRNHIKQAENLLENYKTADDIFHIVIKNNNKLPKNIQPEFICDDFIILLFYPAIAEKIPKIIQNFGDFFEPYTSKKGDLQKIFGTYL